MRKFTEVEEQLIEFIKEKVNKKEFILKSEELTSKKINILEKDLKVLKKLEYWYYLIYIQNNSNYSFTDTITNTYNEKLIDFFFRDNNLYLGEKESYRLYLENFSEKFLNIATYKKNIISHSLDYNLGGKIKIKVYSKIDLFFSLETINLRNLKFEIINPIDILIRIRDKRTLISKDSKFIKYVINTFYIKENLKNKLKFLPISKSLRFKKQYLKLIDFFKWTKIEKELLNLFWPIINKEEPEKLDSLISYNILSDNSDLYNLYDFIKDQEFDKLILTESEANNPLLTKYLKIFQYTFEILEEFKDIKEVEFNKEIAKETAKINKKKDIYHSTTIEGYDIRPSDVEVYLWYKKKDLEDKSPKELEKIIAVKGYSSAFDFIINSPQGEINSEFILDLYQMLWSVAFEINKVDSVSQRLYRTSNPNMMGAIWYSVPSPMIIHYLVEIFCRNINTIENPLLRAIVAHFLFAPIQAFEDWNGRISRFLMNSILLSNNINWKTVEQQDYRLEYLSSRNLWGENDNKNREIIQNTFRKFVKFLMSINN